MIALSEILTAIKPYVLQWCGAYGKGTWTPAFTGLTVTGSPTYAGRYIRTGGLVYWQAKITANGGTTASTVFTTYVNNLPFAASYDSPFTIFNVSAPGFVQVSTTKAYLPTWGASGGDFIMGGVYQTDD